MNADFANFACEAEDNELVERVSSVGSSKVKIHWVGGLVTEYFDVDDAKMAIKAAEIDAAKSK